jgi:phosphocarrier protein HPr
MKTHTITLLNKLGLHARPASHLVKITSRFKNTSVELVRNNEIINAKSILGVMMLAAGFGTELEIRVDGPEEDECLKAVIDLVNSKFYEE